MCGTLKCGMETFSFKNRYCPACLSLKMNLKSIQVDEYSRQTREVASRPLPPGTRALVSPPLECGQDL